MLNIIRAPLIDLCLIAFGLVLVYGGYKNAAEFAALRERGETAQGQVSMVETTVSRSVRYGKTVERVPWVRFTTGNGREIYARVPLPDGRGGQSLSTVTSVRYLPESPTTFQLADAADPSDAQGALGRYMLLAGTLMLVLRFAVKKLIR
jgi:hypothetical protein